MKVKLIRQYDSEGISLSLTLGNEYEVLAVEGSSYRILSDSESQPYGNDPVLFEQECFEVIDFEEPIFWVTEHHDGERHSSPFVWARYFFEDYHDGKKGIRSAFMRHLKLYYPWTWNERFNR